MAGTGTVRRPRVRGLEERFENWLLPLFKRRTEAVGRLLPELYLHGLAAGNFDLALLGLLGDGTPLSAASVARLKAGWHATDAAWQGRPLHECEAVYLWVDGIYVKAGLEKEKAAMLVVLAALPDGRKVILAMESGYRASTESWAAVLRDLKARGSQAPRLVIGDGHLGIWGALATNFPTAAEQRCWNHRLVNLLDKLLKKLQGEAEALLTKIPYAETQAEAETERQKGCTKPGAPRRAVPRRGALDRDWERLVTFYQFPREHWKHLQTTNPVESPFAAVRLRTAAAKRYKKVDDATAVIWKTLLIAEQRLRRLDAPELLLEVAEGTVYVDGRRVKHEREVEEKDRPVFCNPLRTGANLPFAAVQMSAIISEVRMQAPNGRLIRPPPPAFLWCSPGSKLTLNQERQAMAAAHPALGWMWDHPDQPVPIVEDLGCFEIAAVGDASVIRRPAAGPLRPSRVAACTPRI